jgi:hypothetical protein
MLMEGAAANHQKVGVQVLIDPAEGLGRRRDCPVCEQTLNHYRLKADRFQWRLKVA